MFGLKKKKKSKNQEEKTEKGKQDETHKENSDSEAQEKQACTDSSKESLEISEKEKLATKKADEKVESLLLQLQEAMKERNVFVKQGNVAPDDKFVEMVSDVLKSLSIESECNKSDSDKSEEKLSPNIKSPDPVKEKQGTEWKSFKSDEVSVEDTVASQVFITEEKYKEIREELYEFYMKSRASWTMMNKFKEKEPSPEHLEELEQFFKEKQQMIGKFQPYKAQTHQFREIQVDATASEFVSALVNQEEMADSAAIQTEMDGNCVPIGTI